MSTVFSRILDGTLPAEKLYDDGTCIAIHDIHPHAPVHILIIPYKPIVSLAHVSPEDKPLLGHLLYVAHAMAEKLELSTGYRVVINTGMDGLQSVMHLHIHVMGKRGFGWPPG
jgi:histidine triad (HIT) family protein